MQADEADDDSDAKPPILFLHGVFGRPSLLEPWTRYFEAAGFDCHAPALPGRDPTNDDVLRSTGIEDCFNVALDAYDRLDEPPIVIGHSMGGLLTQKIAAARSPRVVVLLASVRPASCGRNCRRCRTCSRCCRPSSLESPSYRHRGPCGTSH